ncbi:ExeM/NucH family extracellular endonuclease [Pelomonas cellulosilytica]|uniref:ExeM/NucH family extracellular endonuclease n=1 Tax=Pelomonas cellulosilytica TaxID=2906762 RepID=A0ABS8XYI9_9BURK|nr:ExeM/NucH family extracellular endonuclease [Pelomonas sp. P8]MCE4556330.1 ExeM/NucH family extracellular endonuclease [Pelomonas sp. P8]
MQLKPLVSLLAAALAAPVALASASGVVISQVYGANGNIFASDYVELHNTGAAVVDLSRFSIQYASATGTGSFAGNGVVALSGLLQPGQFYLVKLATTTGPALPAADATGSLNLSGSAGKVILANVTTGLACNGGSSVCSSTQLAQIEDLVGYGNANFAEGSAAPATTTSTALLRAANGCTDTNSNASDFSTGAPAPRNTATTLSCNGPINQPIVPSCPDASVAAGSATSFSVSATDADSRITAATLVGPLPDGITLGSFTAASGDGAAATQQFNVANTLAAGNYDLGLKWANDEAQTASCSFKLSVSGVTKISAIQGTGARSPMEGATVTTSGVVTKLMSNGFYLQDPLGRHDGAASDGIFVFTSTAPTVSVGQSVRLSGKVTEFNTGAAGNADTLAHTVTQLASPTGITLLGSGNAVTPVELDLATLPAGGLEAYEGMLVTLRGPLMAQQNYFQGRYGQVTIAAGGRVFTPTNVYRPGPDALALQADNARRSILLDDGSTAQNPNPAPYIGTGNTLRAGDTTGSITGVVDYGLATSSNTDFGMYKLHPLDVAGVSFARTNLRVAKPQVTGGNVRIASANVLNFFTSFTNGSLVAGSAGCSLDGATSNSNCRGADNLTEFNRQLAKTVAELGALNADVVGLMEIQNSGSTTVNYLVSQLNAKLGAGTYASVPLPDQGTGSDAIRVAMIYKPGKLTLNGATLSDADAINNRPPLAQGFALPNGEKFAVIVNHLKSKGSCPSGAGPDADDGLQGCWNARRVQQAQRLKTFLQTVKSTAGTEQVVLLGDFNSYAKEDPIDALTSDGSIVDAVAAFDPLDYSYVFDGASGRLDHGLTTAALAPKVVYATSWHINADEPSFIDYNTEFKVPFSSSGSPDFYTATPYRSSDHDPMVMGLNLLKSLTGTDSRDAIVGTPGDDVIEGGPGADTLTGNGGNNQFVYGSMLDAGDVITDFVPGKDTLVLTRLLKSLGIASADPLASGHVTCTASPTGAVIAIDRDGAAGPQRALQLLQLRGVACGALTAASYKF